MYILYPPTLIWEDVTSATEGLPSARYGLFFAAVGDTLFAWGGRDGELDECRLCKRGPISEAAFKRGMGLGNWGQT
eukprot:2886291-Rhodomonas_salina.1